MPEGVKTPCLVCSNLTDRARRGRCPECFAAWERARARNRTRTRPNRVDRTGHRNTEFRKLSERAKKLQPFCIIDGENKSSIEARGDRLETDHLASAHWKYVSGWQLTLDDVQVVCGFHNRELGPSGPGSKRWDEWVNSRGQDGI